MQTESGAELGPALAIATGRPYAESKEHRYVNVRAVFFVALALAALGAALAGPASARAQAATPAPSAPGLSPQEALAEKFAPVAMLKRQPANCDPEGEPYLPAPVDVTLGDPAVTLRRDEGARNPANDPVVKVAPTAQDLARKDGTYYLDLPGDSRQPGCTYEQYSKSRMAHHEPTVYAHIATEPEHDGIALQYWFYYVYNRFNNLHESDWEMIQLTFDASTVAGALQEEPAEVAYAQHGGGEIANWDDDKVQKDGDHPIVYPAAGSHATYYGNHIYLGWGERGSGFGCDDSTGPSIRTPLHVVVTPDQPTASGPFAWLTFEGRWGEKDASPYDGPTGPNTKRQWLEPFSWQDGLRKSSLSLPSQKTVGPNATSFFCAASDTGSFLFTATKRHPWLAYGAGALIVLAPLGLIFVMRRALGAALVLFYRHRWLFLGLGSILFVLGTIANMVEDTVRSIPLGGLLFNLMDLTAPSQVLFSSGGAITQFIGWTLVAPAVVFAVTDMQAGRKPGVFGVYRAALDRFVTLLLATARAGIVVFLLAITIVGIPWAVARTVRWLFITQAVVLRDGTWRNARQLSAAAVRGRWWRTAALSLAIALVLGLVAPLSGILVMIWLVPSPLVANVVGGLVYALLFPLIGITMTLWFEHGERVAPATGARPERSFAWFRWRPRLAIPDGVVNGGSDDA